MISSSSQAKNRRRVAAALAALSSFLCAFVLSAAPALHDHVHSDAEHPQHECAITIVESGVESGDSPVTSARPEAAALFATVPALHPVTVPSPFLSACVFEHAPPALS